MESQPVVECQTKRRRSSMCRSKSTNIILNSIQSAYETKLVFSNPISPKTALEKYNKYISDDDKTFIHNFTELYYLHDNSDHPRYHVEDNNVFYNFSRGAHIAFRYEQLEFLGQGSFGCVIKCYDHKLAKTVAIKCIADNQYEEVPVSKEIMILKRLKSANDHNKNVVEFLDSFSIGGFTFIVTEYSGQNLYELIWEQGGIGFGFKDVRRIAKSIADALVFIHRQNLIHSDLKPENVTVSNGEIKLIDFGCSSFADDEEKPEIVQSLFYRAPEVVFGMGYNTKIDVWSFGCLMYELATGLPLFDCDDENDLMNQLMKVLGDPSKDVIQMSRKLKRFCFRKVLHPENAEEIKQKFLEDRLGNTNNDIIDVISACLRWNPDERPTMEQILEYKFFN